MVGTLVMQTPTVLEHRRTLILYSTNITVTAGFVRIPEPPARRTPRLDAAAT